MREKLFQGLNEEDRKMMEEYLQSKKMEGKSDADIIK
jgi:hypothetical protein